MKTRQKAIKKIEDKIKIQKKTLKALATRYKENAEVQNKLGLDIMTMNETIKQFEELLEEINKGNGK